MIYAFERYELDTCCYELRCTGEVVPLEPLVFKVLMYLIEHRDHAVSKDELIEHLWSGQFLSDSVLVQSVVKARRAIDDNGRAQRYIKTLLGHGYRFIAPVKVYDTDGPAAQAPLPHHSDAQCWAVSQLMTPRQEAPERWWHALPVADRRQALAMLQALLGRDDGEQGQVVCLAIRFDASQAESGRQDRASFNAGSHVLQLLN